jgi:hypothetical protein
MLVYFGSILSVAVAILIACFNLFLLASNKKYCMRDRNLAIRILA